MSNKLHTYIITLNKTRNDFPHYKLFNPTIIDGINGKLLNKEKNNISYSYFNSTFLHKSVMGCALAHIKCWKKHILNSNTYTLILEDDFFIELDSEIHNIIKYIGFNNLINIYLSHTPKDFDILYLGSLSGLFIKTCFKLINKTSNYKKINNFIAKPEIALGLHSYILSDSGIIKLLNSINNNKINFHIDTYIQSLSSQKKINTYITIPKLIYQSSTYKNTSSLTTLIKCPIFNNIYIDKYLTLNYLVNVSIVSIFDYNFSVWIIFLICICFIFIKIIIKFLNNN